MSGAAAGGLVAPCGAYHVARRVWKVSSPVFPARHWVGHPAASLQPSSPTLLAGKPMSPAIGSEDLSQLPPRTAVHDAVRVSSEAGHVAAVGDYVGSPVEQQRLLLLPQPLDPSVPKGPALSLCTC